MNGWIDRQIERHIDRQIGQIDRLVSIVRVDRLDRLDQIRSDQMR